MLFHRSNSILASKGEENAEFLAKMAKELPLKTTMSHIQQSGNTNKNRISKKHKKVP